MSVYRRWKYVERRVAKLLGGTRVTRKGSAEVDVEHKWLGIEVKSMEHLPKWLIEAMAQSEANSPKDKLPIVVLCEKQGAEIVCIRLEQFIAWFISK